MPSCITERQGVQRKKKPLESQPFRVVTARAPQRRRRPAPCPQATN
jgi:hypothetical protein